MKDHYEWPNEHDNIFMIEGVPQLLSNSAEQISEEERHYSNLRFALFTIFMATSGALGALHLNKEYVESTRLIHNELPIIGLLMTIAFASLEFAIDWIETEYRYMANAVWRYYRQHLLSGTQPNNSLSVGGASIEISWVRGPIWGIFVLAALTWTFLAAPTNPTDSFIPYIPYILAWCIVGISILFFWYFLKTKGRPHADELSVKLISNR